ncbi:MAG: hypothetical protein O7F71_04265 [Gammaproteobacteria bacterium]|nr:hypothetical protein [Gammaproteobacteria bacterium]
MNNTRWFIGSALLGGVLVFGLYGIVINATESEALYEQDTLYIEECGACHLAYPPGLLPVQSWQGIMSGLEDHFGESAETDEDTATHIGNYLERVALQKGKPSPMSQMLRNMPADPPLRITEFPAFIAAHAEIPKQLQVEKLDEGFLSPCADCHRQAASGLFDKELLHPGYGPSVWADDC